MPAITSSLIKWLKTIPTRRIFSVIVFTFLIFFLLPATVKANSDPMSCTDFLNVNIQGCVNLVVAKIGEITLTISAKVLLITGILFNIAMKLTVNLASFIDNMPIVLETWRTIRDMCSLVFVFALIYNAFLQIFGKGNPKKLIVDIVIAGLLINFSYFIGRTAIDLSNVISIQFYKAMIPAQTCPTCVTGEDTLDGGISSALMQGLKVQSLYSNVDNVQGDNVALATSQARPIWDIIFQVYFGSFILFTVAGIFLMVSLLFLARMAFAILLLTLSPLYFINMVIPGMGGSFGGSWKNNMETIVKEPIVFFFLLYVGLKIVLSDTFARTMNGGGISEATFANAAAGIGSSITVIGQYVIVLIILGTAAAAALKVGGDNVLSKGIIDNTNKFTGWLKNKYGKFTPHGAMNAVTTATANKVASTTARISANTPGWIAKQITNPDKEKGSGVAKWISSKATSLAVRSRLAEGVFNKVAKVGVDYDERRKADVTQAYKDQQQTLKAVGIPETQVIKNLRAEMANLKRDFDEKSKVYSDALKAYKDSDAYKNGFLVAKKSYDDQKALIDSLKTAFELATPGAEKTRLQNEITAATPALTTAENRMRDAKIAAQQGPVFAAYKTARTESEAAREAMKSKKTALEEAEKKAKEQVQKEYREARETSLLGRVLLGHHEEKAALALLDVVKELKAAQDEKKKVEKEITAQKKKLETIKKELNRAAPDPKKIMDFEDVKGELEANNNKLVKLLASIEATEKKLKKEDKGKKDK